MIIFTVKIYYRISTYGNGEEYDDADFFSFSLVRVQNNAILMERMALRLL